VLERGERREEERGERRREERYDTRSIFISESDIYIVVLGSMALC
jgi:hypothetical protein